MIRTIPWLVVALLAGLFSGAGAANAATTGAVQWQPTTYTTSSGTAAQLDFYSPPASAGNGPFPAIVLVHGGSWVQGDKMQITALAHQAAQHGYVVANINYPYATAARPGWEAQVRDVETLVGLLRASAAALRTDPSRIAIWGHSAGATIAAMVAARGVTPVQALVGFSGLYDLRSAIQASPSLAGQVKDWTGCDPTSAACSNTVADASPISHLSAAMPPTYLVSSSAELSPVNQVQVLDSALTSLGVPHATKTLPGSNHGWQYSPDQTPAALSWLDDTLGFTPPTVPYATPTVDPITTWYLSQFPQPGQPLGERLTAGPGQMQDMDTASIYWTSATGVHTTKGAIRDQYRALGGPTGVLAWPTTDERTTPDGFGRYNHFSGTAPAGSSIYWTPSTGAREVLGAIRARWSALGWERSYLGYPTSGEYAVPGGRRSNFQRGYITWTPSGGARDYRY